MRKLILSSLLFCGTITAQTTYQQVSDLINKNLASGIRIQANKHREVEFALLDFSNQNSAQQYDIKAIYANSTYLGDNFESNGLGKNLRTGWAICNGKNSTPNIGGRVIVSYGGAFTTLNATGGEKDHVLTESELPAHSHGLPSHFGGALDIQSLTTTNGADEGLSETNRTANTGTGQPHNNMPPYIVLVYIMKL